MPKKKATSGSADARRKQTVQKAHAAARKAKKAHDDLTMHLEDVETHLQKLADDPFKGAGQGIA